MRDEVIVSLTVISPRVRALPRVLASILGQSRPPDRVCVWISEEALLFDRGLRARDLPRSVRALATAGRIEIRTCENIGPNRKAVPTLRELEGESAPALVVTADDDVLYPKRWLECLLDGHARHPEAIVCFRARRITCDERGMAPYRDWPRAAPEAELLAHDLLVTGIGGMLIDPTLMDPRVCSDDIHAVALTRSDAWLGGAYLAKGTPVLKLSTNALMPDPTGLELVDGELPPVFPERHPFLRALIGKGYKRRAALHNHNRPINDETLPRAFAYYGVDALAIVAASQRPTT